MIAQGTPEWHEQRAGKVTGSVAGAILGLSPFSTPADVMNNLLGKGKKFEGNVATEYGSFHEEYAIADLQILKNVIVEETGFHVHKELDWLGASPDGFIGDDIVAEIKCPFGKRNEENPVFKTAQEQPHYYAQMQLEMYCTDRHTCWFYQWTKNAQLLEVIYLDHIWIETNIPKLREFYQSYLSQLNADDTALVTQYQETKIALDYAKEQFEAAKEAVIEQSNKMKSPVVGSLKVTNVERKGSIDYKKVPELSGVDLEQYRKAATHFWKVS